MSVSDVPSALAVRGFHATGRVLEHLPFFESAGEQFRATTADRLRHLLTGSHDGISGLVPATQENPGLFGPDSLTWQVHSHPAMLVGGLRALLVQSMHPLVMAGVAEHSQYREDPLGRLARTVRYVAATTYSPLAEVDAMLSMVEHAHTHVRGIAPDGRPYAANDPDLLAWVHNTQVQSFLLAYRWYGPGLDDMRANQYIVEMAALGERVGAFDLPRTTYELNRWIDQHPDRKASAQAQDAARFLLHPPLVAPARQAYVPIAAGALAAIPKDWRRELHLPTIPHPVGPLLVACALRPATSVLLRLLSWTLAHETPDRPAGVVRVARTAA